MSPPYLLAQSHSELPYEIKQPLKALALSTALLIVPSIDAAQNHGYAIDYIQGEGDVKGLKLAYQYHLPNEKLPFEHARILNQALMFGMAKTTDIKRISLGFSSDPIPGV